MKKILLLLLVLAAARMIYAQDKIVVDPNASVRNVTGSFKAIKISGGIDLFLSQSNTEVVAVSASEEKYKESIKTVVENDMLVISYEGDKLWNSQKRKLRAYVSFKTLEKLQASGACDVTVSGSITGNSLAMQLSGACDFKGAVKVTTLKLNLSGASDVAISGTATNVHIESTGASDVKGFELVSEYCTAKAAGASDINITVNKELSATASGASDISFKGEALMKEVNTNGSSNVGRKKGR